MITRLNAVHALLYLIVSLLAVAVVFYTLWARRSSPRSKSSSMPAPSWCCSCSSSCCSTWVRRPPAPKARTAEARHVDRAGDSGGHPDRRVRLSTGVSSAGAGGGNVARAVSPQRVGVALFGPYLLGVELASMLLLAGLVGAYHLGWRKPSRAERSNRVAGEVS